MGGLLVRAYLETVFKDVLSRFSHVGSILKEGDDKPSEDVIKGSATNGFNFLSSSLNNVMCSCYAERRALLSEHLKNRTKQERMLQQCKELYINA